MSIFLIGFKRISDSEKIHLNQRRIGGEILSVMTHEQLMGAQHELKDKVMHLSMVVAGGSSIFMADSFDQGPGISLSIAYKTESYSDKM